ncbi:MAG: hypothetical protein HY302_16905 [Opitutae bacterium]|nr:hypothetical protein [Opitutae bacterium]
MRVALSGLSRDPGSPARAKHHVFVFLDGNALADDAGFPFASDDAFRRGVPSGRVHVVFGRAAGGARKDGVLEII